MSTNPVHWVAGLLSLACYSFIFLGPNPAFSLTEHLVVGTAAGYTMGVSLTSLANSAFKPLFQGNLKVVMPIVLGLLLYFKFIPKYRWIERIPAAFMVGLATGVGVRGTVQSDILAQVKATMLPLGSFSNLVLIVVVVAVIWYFFLSFKSKSQVGTGLSVLGKWAMMSSFGFVFASAVSGRFSLLIKNFQFILSEWLGLY